MGVSPAADCAVAVHDAYCGPFPVELSLAAIFPFSSCDLRGGSAANEAPASDRSYISACNRSVNRFRIACYVFLHSHKRRCAEIQFCSRAAQTCAARSTATLSQCLSLGGADVLRLK